MGNLLFKIKNEKLKIKNEGKNFFINFIKSRSDTLLLIFNLKIFNYLFILVSLFLIFSTGCAEVKEELKSLLISPSSATIGVNQSQLFTVIGKDELGAIVQVTPTWSVTGGIGTISSTGLFSAASTTGEGYVVASYEAKSASAKVIVTDKGWLVGRIQSIISSGFVAGIKVYLIENSALSDFSDSKGLYSIAGIPAGTYEARTEPTALYMAASQEVTIGKGETTTWNIFLETHPGIPMVPTTTIPTF